MGAFWQDMEPFLGQEKADEASVLCVLTVDDVGHPQRVTFDIVRSGGEVVVSMKFKRKGEVVYRLTPRSEALSNFDHLAKSVV